MSPTPQIICQEVKGCSKAPCQNGGTCVDGDSGYTCICRNGFTGIECEVTIDYCKQNNIECHNGGICHSISETASTMCRDCNIGFGGKYCNDTVSPCLGKPCQNGECQESSNDKGTSTSVKSFPYSLILIEISENS